MVTANFTKNFKKREARIDLSWWLINLKKKTFFFQFYNIVGESGRIFLEITVYRHWMASGFDQSRYLGNTFLRKVLCFQLHPWLNGTVIWFFFWKTKSLRCKVVEELEQEPLFLSPVTSRKCVVALLSNSTKQQYAHLQLRQPKELKSNLRVSHCAQPLERWHDNCCDESNSCFPTGEKAWW